MNEPIKAIFAEEHTPETTWIDDDRPMEQRTREAIRACRPFPNIPTITNEENQCTF